LSSGRERCANLPWPARQPLSELLKVAITPGEKRAAFEAAAKHGVTASELVRQALALELQAA
jgi:predicted HicB family RNase H-like nuclease